ncbi:MAG: outer membrane lipoprotein-sorting protein [Magnetococcus sp. YQC-5]
MNPLMKMMKMMKPCLGGLAWLWVVWLSVTPAFGMEADEILQQMERKMQSKSYEMFSRIAFELPNGRVRTVSLYTALKSGRQALAVVVAPDEFKGRAALRDGDDVWMHIPGELELRKSNLMFSLVGGIFNNADLLTGFLFEDYQPTLLDEDETGWRLELRPRFGSAPYARMELRVNKKNGLPLTLSQFDSSGALIKTIHYQDVQTVDGEHLRPMVLTSASELNTKYRSTWSVGQMTSRDFPLDAFTRGFLSRAGTLMK